MNINFELNAVDIYERVGRTTALIGAKRMSDETNGVYEKVFASNKSHEELVGYADEAFYDLVQASGVYDNLSVVSETEDDAHDYTVKLLMPSKFSGSVNELKSCAMNYVVNSIIYRWLMVAYPNEASAYKEYMQSGILEYKMLLSERSRPKRTKIDVTN